jgi:hypothetical protein
VGETKLNLTMAGNELVLREGKAAEPLPTREPNRIRIDGDIRTVGNYVTKRRAEAISALINAYPEEEFSAGLQAIDASRAVLTVDRRERVMSLAVDPEDYYGVVVTGKLELAPELLAFGINTTQMWKRDELHKFLKFNRVYFTDKEQWQGVINGLMRVRVKTEQELNVHQDNRGNKGGAYEQKVVGEEGIAKFFDLKIPIYKGEAAMSFQVELCYDVSGGILQFWLESVGLRELELEVVNALIDGELAKCEGLLIVNK